MCLFELDNSRLDKLEAEVKTTREAIKKTASGVASVARAVRSERRKRKDNQKNTMKRQNSLKGRMNEKTKENAKKVSTVESVKNLKEETDDNFTLIGFIFQIGVFCTLIGVIYVSGSDAFEETRNLKSFVNLGFLLISAVLRWLIEKNKFVCCVLKQKFIVGVQQFRGSIIDTIVISISTLSGDLFGKIPLFFGITLYVLIFCVIFHLLYYNLSTLWKMVLSFSECTWCSCCVKEAQSVDTNYQLGGDEQNEASTNGTKTNESNTPSSNSQKMAIIEIDMKNVQNGM